MANFLTHFPWLFGATGVPRVGVDKYGVSLTSGLHVSQLLWHEVVQIDAFQNDQSPEAEIVFEFRLKAPERTVLISEGFPEGEKLVRFLETEWPKISPDWRTQVIRPPLAPGRTTVYSAPI